MKCYSCVLAEECTNEGMGVIDVLLVFMNECVVKGIQFWQHFPMTRARFPPVDFLFCCPSNCDFLSTDPLHPIHRPHLPSFRRNIESP